MKIKLNFDKIPAVSL